MRRTLSRFDPIINDVGNISRSPDPFSRLPHDKRAAPRRRLAVVVSTEATRRNVRPDGMDTATTDASATLGLKPGSPLILDSLEHGFPDTVRAVSMARQHGRKPERKPLSRRPRIASCTNFHLSKPLPALPPPHSCGIDAPFHDPRKKAPPDTGTGTHDRYRAPQAYLSRKPPPAGANRPSTTCP